MDQGFGISSYPLLMPPSFAMSPILLTSLAITFAIIPGTHADSGFMGDFFQRFPDLPGFQSSGGSETEESKDSFRGYFDTLEYMHNKREAPPPKDSDNSEGDSEGTVDEDDNEIHTGIIKWKNKLCSFIYYFQI
jgi:hypothetical protein